MYIVMRRSGFTLGLLWLDDWGEEERMRKARQYI